jgi:hypothetical protein
MDVLAAHDVLEVRLLGACWSDCCPPHGDRMAMVELERALQLADADASAAASGLVVFDTAKVFVSIRTIRLLSPG